MSISRTKYSTDALMTDIARWSSIGAHLLRIVVEFRHMYTRPDTAQDIPAEGSVMRFIRIAAQPLQVMPGTGIDVNFGGDSFLPIVLAVFFASLLEVLCYLKDHCSGVPLSEFGESGIQMLDIAGSLEVVNFWQDAVGQKLGYHVKRKQITSAFALLHISDCAGIKFTAVS
jgi:hypothetical protein